jgi:hypothetical protein
MATLAHEVDEPSDAVIERVQLPFLVFPSSRLVSAGTDVMVVDPKVVPSSMSNRIQVSRWSIAGVTFLCLPGEAEVGERFQGLRSAGRHAPRDARWP